MRKGINGLIVHPNNELEARRPQGMKETEFVMQLICKCKRFPEVRGA